MSTTPLRVNLDGAASARLERFTKRLDKTPYRLIQQAIASYLDQLDLETAKGLVS